MAETENLKKKTISGVAWNFAGNTANRIVQFVISIVLARLLTPSDYGLLGLIAIFMAIASTFIDSGFTSALIQYKDRTEKDLNTVFYVNLGMSTFMYIILFFVAPLIADFYTQPLLIPVIRWYSIILILGALTGVNSTLLTIRLDYKTSTRISVISAISSGIIGIIFAYLGYGVWALVIQSISGSAIRTVISFYWVRWFPKRMFSSQSFKRMFGYGSKLLIANLIHAIYDNIYGLVIGKKFNASSLGYFTRAQGFINLTAQNVTGILSGVAFPVLSKVQDDDEKLLRIYDRYVQMSSFIIFPLVLFLCGISKPLILFLLTDKWAPSIPLLQILCFNSIWLGLISINLNLLYVKGRTDLVLKLEIFKKSTAFLILFISVFFNSLTALCWGLVLYGVIALYLNSFYTKRLLNFGLLDQLKQVKSYFIAATVILIEAFSFSELIENPLLSLMVSTIICISSYLYICKRLKLYAYGEVMNIVMPKIKALPFLNKKKF